jgi:hypothetical protein
MSPTMAIPFQNDLCLLSAEKVPRSSLTDGSRMLQLHSRMMPNASRTLWEPWKV